MRKCNVIILLLVSCFIILGCFNKNLSSDIGETITTKEDLKKTRKIKIKDVNKAKTIKIISSESEINEIVDFIITGKIIEEGEYIVYIGPSYILEMIDEKGNIFETIDLFIPYGVPKYIELNKLNEFYYIDVDKILTILNIQKDL